MGATIASRDKTMIRKLLTASVLAATLVGASLASTGTAEARWGRGGAFAAGAAVGVLGGALLAAPAYGYGYGPGYYAAPAPVYYEPACFWRKQRLYDAYGYPAGWQRVRVCR
jgi:hypothetical protein